MTGDRPNGDAGAPLMLSVSGCRGVVGASLTPEVAARFATAVGAWLSEQGGEPGDSVVRARDGRAGGRVWAGLAGAALSACGFRVIDLGVAATPTAGVMVEHHAAAGGVVITASHNPQEWNGMKALDRRGRAPHPKEAGRIRERFDNPPARLAPWDALGRMDADDTGAHVHVARVLAALEGIVPASAIRERRLRVAVDSVNASGAPGARLLLEGLGCEVTSLSADESGRFPHPPEPTAANLGDLQDAARAGGVDVAFAQDPDADRLAIVDEQGRYIGEEKTLALAGEALLGGARAGGETPLIAVNLSTSRMIEDVAAARGAEVRRTPVGEANVVAGMDPRPGRLVFGGEGNGGVIWPEVVSIRDSLGAMALILALMVREDRPISDLADRLPAYEIVKEKTPIEGVDPARALRRVGEVFADARVDRQDGVRVDLPDEKAWIHARASNTEPILRVIAEAPTRARAAALAETAMRAVRDAG